MQQGQSGANCGRVRGLGARAAIRSSVLLCAFWVTSAVAQPACQMPQDLLALARSLSALSAQSGSVADWQVSRLSRDLTAMSETAVLREMSASGLEAATGTAMALMSEAQRILSSGQLRDAAMLRDLLTQLDGAGQTLCSPEGGTIFQQSQQENFGSVYSDGRLDWPALNRQLKEDKALSFGALIAALSGLILVLYLGDSLFRWIMARIYNRKACRIPASLHVGATVLPGLIVTLGKGGCRFHPENQEDFGDVLTELRGTLSRIRVEGQAFPVRVSAIYDVQSDFRFQAPITLRTQKTLLAQSTISPYTVKKSRDGDTARTEGLV